MYLHDSIETNTHTRVRKGKPDTYTTKKTLHHFKCDNCSNIFTRPKNGKRRDKRDVHFCPTCPAYSLAQKETVKSKLLNTIERGKSDRGYKEVYVGDDYPYRKTKWVREHIYVMELHIKQRIPKGMVVHHIDGNKQNNNLDNLLLCTVAQHNKCHAKIEKLVFELLSQGLVDFDRENLEYFYKDNL